MEAGPAISLLNQATNNCPVLFQGVRMSRRAHTTLLRMDFDNWHDVKLSTKCSDDAIEQMKSAIKCWEARKVELMALPQVRDNGTIRGCSTAMNEAATKFWALLNRNWRRNSATDAHAKLSDEMAALRPYDKYKNVQVRTRMCARTRAHTHMPQACWHAG